MSSSPLELIPFVLTTRANAPYLRLDQEALGMSLRMIWVEDQADAAFGQLLNDTNQLAFGGADMGMPLWVLLDCGILPSAVVGFAARREQLEAQAPELLKKVGVRADYQHELVPLSEYCGSIMVEPGAVCGFSLQSQLEGVGLGTRTKALAMWIYKATAQVGVTQFDNAAIRVHTHMGPLRVQIHRPSVHTHPTNSFVYRVTLPGPDELAKMARGEQRAADAKLPRGNRWSFETWREDSHAELSQLVRVGAKVWIVPPAWRMSEQGAILELLVELPPPQAPPKG